MSITHTASGHNEQLSCIRRYFFSLDHKVIGMQYLLTGLFMALVGGYLAYIFRSQLAYPGQDILGYGKLTADRYNTFITMHGTIMIFWVAMPVMVAALGNLLIPLMVGTDDMAFPVLNMISYQIFLFSTVILLASFFVPNGAFAGGWTAYPPLSANNGYQPVGFWDGLGGHMWIVAVALEFVSFLIGGINFLVTTFNKRAPGLTWFRLPIFVWMIIAAVLLFMFSVGPLIAGAVMLLFDRTIGTGFFNPAEGGDPILFQHLFWFFGHPEVYVILLPGLGVLVEVITTFSRKPLFGYRLIIWSTVIAGFLSFVVWAHHQFIAGIDPRMATFFSITTIMISIPFAAIIFAAMATFWKGSIQFSTANLFAIGFLMEFLVGGVTGIYLGSSAFDIYAHDTYFVVAHFHYTLIPVVFFCGLAAIYFWYPKFIGRMLNETLGKIHFLGTVLAFNSIFMPLFLVGMAGQHRRIFDYSRWPALMTPELTHLRVIATTALYFLIVFQIPFFFNLIYSRFRGPKAPANPWQANSLEWTVPSPPPHGNFAAVPTVFRGPYEYSHPDHEADWWPQNAPEQH